MIEPKDVVVDGMEFNLQPLPALKAIKLDKKVVSLIIPALSGSGNLDLDKKIDMGAVSKGIAEALGKLSDDELEELIVELLSTTIYKKKGSTPQGITAEIINDEFRGEILTLYKLAFEVMKFNKFSPFVLMEDGNVMKKILTSKAVTKEQKKSGSKLGKSGLLPETSSTNGPSGK